MQLVRVQALLKSLASGSTSISQLWQVGDIMTPLEDVYDPGLATFYKTFNEKQNAVDDGWQKNGRQEGS